MALQMCANGNHGPPEYCILKTRSQSSVVGRAQVLDLDRHGFTQLWHFTRCVPLVKSLCPSEPQFPEL